MGKASVKEEEQFQFELSRTGERSKFLWGDPIRWVWLI